MSYVRFTPRRPIKSFTDLEVYQKLLNVAVVVVKRISPGKNETERNLTLKNQLCDLLLSLPMKIAEAHSIRFSDKTKGLAVLEEVMLGCNRAVVYLELVRDLCATSAGTSSATAVDNTGTGTIGIENDFFEEKIKDLQTVRWKVMHLARSWEKFSQTP